MTGINTRSLRWLGVLVPLLFWCIVILAESLILRVPIVLPVAAAETILITLGSTLFANWVATSLERQQAELRQRTEYLEALRDASLVLTTELELGKVLQRVVDLSRTLVNARYGALAVRSVSGTAIDYFFTSGLTEEQRTAMISPPAGHGLLGLMTRDGDAILVNDVLNDERSAGFPEGHPIMHSLVGVPIVSKGTIFGNLYLSDKEVELSTGGRTRVDFTEEDQDLLEMFAAQAAIAIENAQLYRENQQLAVLRERERIGMDLHDGVIQSIYAIGLLLDDAAHRIEADPEHVQQTITIVIAGLNDVNKDIRAYIQDLRPQRFQGRGVEEGLEQLVQELRTDTLLTVQMEVDPQAAGACSPRQANEFLHIAKEALANIRKHAHAKTIMIQFGFADGLLQLLVQDDGRGLDMPQGAAAVVGNGLRNMRERARALHGEFRLSSAGGIGTQVIATAPIEKRDA